MLPIDTTFPANYRLEPDADLPGAPGNQPQIYIPPSPEEDKVSRIVTRVIPHSGEPWFGLFAKNFYSEETLSGLWHSPDPERFCVVAGGFAYSTAATLPLDFSRVPLSPVRQIFVCKEFELLVMCDFIRALAIGPDGVAWESAALSWDGIKLTGLVGDRLHGFGWEPWSDREVPFAIDLRTGLHAGGAISQEQGRRS